MFVVSFVQHFIGYKNISQQLLGKIHTLNTFVKQGAVVLEAPRNIPEFFPNLFQADDPLSKHFRNNIRQYNSALSFTSLRYTSDPRLSVGGVQNFQIHGELYHMLRYINTKLHDNDPPHYVQYSYTSMILHLPRNNVS